MSSTAVIAIVIAAVVVLAAIAFVTAARRGDVRRGAGSLSRETRRRDRSTPAPVAEEVAVTGREVERAAVAERSTALEPARSATPAPWSPPDAETLGFTRRQFFNRSAVTLMGVGLSGFGVACIAFLWPKLGGGFGSKVTVGKVDDLNSQIEGAKNALYLAEARTWLVQYPKEALPKAEKVYSSNILSGMELGFVALYQKCVHLGCRVPFCDSSGRFECPCHGSVFDIGGEWIEGPSPVGMTQYAISTDGDTVVVDTSKEISGPPRGANQYFSPPKGPNCQPKG